MRLGIIGAMEVEVESIRKRLEGARRHEAARLELWEGTLEGCPVVVVRSGIAKVNAALCVQLLVDRFGVTRIVNTGVAGSLDPALDIGDLVVSRDCVHHDVDATIWGYAPGEVPQLGTVAFPADRELVALALRAAAEAAPEVRAVEGRVASGEAFVSSDAEKRRISETFGASCCEMEGAAIAQAAWVNQVPYVVVRAISDKADGSAKMLYPIFEAKAARHCAGVVSHMAALLA